MAALAMWVIALGLVSDPRGSARHLAESGDRRRARLREHRNEPRPPLPRDATADRGPSRRQGVRRHETRTHACRHRRGRIEDGGVEARDARRPAPRRGWRFGETVARPSTIAAAGGVAGVAGLAGFLLARRPRRQRRRAAYATGAGVACVVGGRDRAALDPLRGQGLTRSASTVAATGVSGRTLSAAPAARRSSGETHLAPTIRRPRLSATRSPVRYRGTCTGRNAARIPARAAAPSLLGRGATSSACRRRTSCSPRSRTRARGRSASRTPACP